MLQLKCMDKSEIEGAWKMYSKFKLENKPIYKPKFSLGDLEFKNRLLVETFTNPLNLRLFLEMNSGKKLTTEIISRMDIWKDWNAYIYKLIPGAHDFLNALIDECFKKRSTVVEFDELYDHPILGKYMRDDAVDSIYRRLVKNGTLSWFFKDDIPYVGFAVESMFLYMLVELLKEDENYKNTEALIDLLKGESMPGLDSVVSYVLENDVRSGSIKKLSAFINNHSAYCKYAAVALYTAFEINGVENVNLALFKEKTEAHLVLINTVFFMLIKNYKFETFENIAKIILNDRNLPECDAYATILDQIARYFISKKVDKQSLGDELNILKKSVSIRKKLKKYDKLALGKTLEQISGLCSVQGLKGESRKYRIKALDIYKSALGEDHSRVLSVILDQFADDLPQVGFTDKIQKIHDLFTLWFTKKVVGYERLEAKFYSIISKYYCNLFELDKAKNLLGKALSIQKMRLGSNHPLVANYYDDMAILYIKNGQTENSLAMYEKAAEILEKTLGSGHSETLKLFRKLASEYGYLSAHRDPKYLQHAVKYYEKTLSVLNNLENPTESTEFDLNHVYEDYVSTYAQCCSQTDVTVDKALRLYKTVLERLETNINFTFTSREVSEKKAKIYDEIGNIYQARYLYKSAVSYYQKSFKIYTDIGVGDARLTDVRSNIIETFIESGDYDKASQFENEYPY